MYKDITSNKRNSLFLVVIFFAVLLGVGIVFDQFYGSAEVPYIGLIFALIFSIIMVLVSYFKGDKIALKASGAKKIAKTDNPYYYNMVENLCITAGLPKPELYIITDNSINAFATGRKPDKASVAVTTGALQKLENEELEGVLAHELSHIKNYDIRFMTLVAVLVGSIAILADIFFRFSLFGGGRKRDNGGNGILMIVGLIFVILSPIIAQLIKFAISRKREYLADASASLLTRYPEGLANALRKIQLENQPMTRTSKATAHLFIANPFQGKKLKNIFSTHPPIEDRIKRLLKMGK